MIKLTTSPLVLAAALGLLGPAALIDDDEDVDLAGMWSRVQEQDSAMRQGSAVQLGQLGERIQLLPVDDSYLLDEGTAHSTSTSHWTTGAVVHQELEIDGVEITREFRPNGDELTVRTIVSQGESTHEYTDLFTRIS